MTFIASLEGAVPVSIIELWCQICTKWKANVSIEEDLKRGYKYYMSKLPPTIKGCENGKINEYYSHIRKENLPIYISISKGVTMDHFFL